MDQVAIAARQVGLGWKEPRVADFEGGRIAPSLPTILAVCGALSIATGRETTLLDLLKAQGDPVAINEHWAMTGDNLVRLISGGVESRQGGATTSSSSRMVAPVKRAADFSPPFILRPVEAVVAEFLKDLKSKDKLIIERYKAGVEAEDLPALLRDFGAAEDRVRRELDISAYALALLAVGLWGQSFADERDERAGADANVQKRGQVTRRMKEELDRAIAELNTSLD